MFVKTSYCLSVRAFLSSLSVFSCLIFPTITLAHPSFGSECSSCHASADTGSVEAVLAAEDSTTLTTESDLTEPTVTIAADSATLPAAAEVEITPTANPTELTTVPSDNKVDQFITQLDLNGDGQVTQDEVQALRSEFFDSADTNADGFITNEEWQAIKETQATQLLVDTNFGCKVNFNRLDNDQDGLISKAEFVNNVPMFDKFDLDGDGIILAEELTLKKPHQHWMAHKNRYNNWINDQSYHVAEHKKPGNFGRH